MPEPAFYCENCGRKVSARDKVCPCCGRFFTDVRCPRCNCTGDAGKFYFGCPQCGYMNPAWLPGNAASASSSAFIEVLNPAIFEGNTLTPELPPEKSPALPPWFFLSITIGLGTVCAVVFYLIIV